MRREKMSEYTEGPWFVDVIDFAIRENNNLETSENQKIAEISGPFDNKEQKANAQLISAAPELLEAAEEALKYFKDKISKMDDINEEEEAPEWVVIPMKLEAAIQKAEGDNDG